jgi:hypothetical protein
VSSDAISVPANTICVSSIGIHVSTNAIYVCPHTASASAFGAAATPSPGKFEHMRPHTSIYCYICVL